MRDVNFHKTFLVVALWLAGLGAAAQFAKFAVPFDLLRDQYPDAGAQIGWTLTLISAVGALMGMTAGVIVVKAGLGRSLILALLLGAALSFWQATLPSLPVMLISRILEGASHLIIVVAAPTLIIQVCSGRNQRFGMTLWSTFFGVGFAIMAWFGLPFAKANGLTALLNTHGGVMVALACVLVIALRGSDPANPPATSPLTLKSVAHHHVRAYTSPHIAAPALGWLFYTMTFLALLTVLPDLIPLEVRARIISVLPLVGIPVSLIIVSAMMVYLSAATVVVIGFACSAAACVGYFLGLPVTFMAIGLFSVLGLVQGASFALVPELNTTQESRALANGAMAQMGNLGNLVGTPILLAVLANAGQSAMMMIVLALYLIGGLMHGLLAYAREQRT